MLIKLFNPTITNPEEYHLLFVIEKDHTAVLNFSQSFIQRQQSKKIKSARSRKTARFDSVSERSV
jgi:hypothetical protein